MGDTEYFFYNEIDFSIYISDIMDRLWLMKTYSGLPVLLTFQNTDVTQIMNRIEWCPSTSHRY